ncbi:MAG: hypothetical protein IPJ27_03770 [Candidatus Accumulibacter sp.]|uniref:Uncharacterized protein n=1 Tax=Candidatus Accumulibacter proximus TaxID=2954385 RepID=A0A935UG14_9PROT|nr:hypothetical protein [Candidatus Accumulibacter proximus]
MIIRAVTGPDRDLLGAWLPVVLAYADALQPDNFFGNPENIYVGVAAFQHAVFPMNPAMQVTEAQMITDSRHHPLL